MLATECLCNLSLGPEISCEKVAQKIGTYLHTFLQSSNESIVVSMINQIYRLKFFFLYYKKSFPFTENVIMVFNQFDCSWQKTVECFIKPRTY